jgi:hypothetical protein
MTHEPGGIWPSITTISHFRVQWRGWTAVSGPALEGGKRGRLHGPPDPRGSTPYTQTHTYVHARKKSPKEKGQAPVLQQMNRCSFNRFPKLPSVGLLEFQPPCVESAADADHAAQCRRSVPCATGPAPVPTCPCLAPLLLDFSSWLSHWVPIPNSQSVVCRLQSLHHDVCYHVSFNFQFPNFVIVWTSGVGF